MQRGRESKLKGTNTIPHVYLYKQVVYCCIEDHMSFIDPLYRSLTIYLGFGNLNFPSITFKHFLLTLQ